jgi:hypothetical protein
MEIRGWKAREGGGGVGLAGSARVGAELFR